MLEKEYNYFVEHQEELFSKYPNMYIIIVENRVLGSFRTINEALEFAYNSKLEPGEFLTDICTGKIEPQTFHSRVIFS